MSNFWLKRQYAEVSTSSSGLAERGYVYTIGEFFTVSAGATARFGMTTNGVEVEFQFYDITSDLHPVKANLIEAPSSVTNGVGSITPRNLNRNYPDNASATLYPVTAITGGTVIGTELVGSGAKAGGFVSQTKIFTLKPDTVYVMAFENTGAQATACHFSLGWSEAEPSPKPLWTA